MMLNIDSEPIATPITNPRCAKKLRSTSGALARDSTVSSTKNAVAASTNGPTTGSGAARACGNPCSPKTSATITVASKTKPIQSVLRLRAPSARAVAEPAEVIPGPGSPDLWLTARSRPRRPRAKRSSGQDFLCPVLIEDMKVLRMQGHSLRVIADKLGVGRGTVEKYTKGIETP